MAIIVSHFGLASDAYKAVFSNVVVSPDDQMF